MSIFNIRVYALLINEKNEVLVTDEFRFGKEMTKFPGGGLHWGEGTIDCLKRECMEELGCEIEVISHFYTTDFFQEAAFYEKQQLISIYYIVKNISPLTPTLPRSAKALREGEKGANGNKLFMAKNDPDHPFRDGRVEGAQSFRWVSISNLTEDEFTFPIDKKVAGMLKASILN